HCKYFDLYYLFSIHVTATTVIYTLSLHDALPISCFQFEVCECFSVRLQPGRGCRGWSVQDHERFVGGSGIRLRPRAVRGRGPGRSEEHTSELQSRSDLVCRLLLEKKKKTSWPSFG